MEKPFPPREEGNETYSSPGRGTVKLFIPPNEEEENERFPPPGRSTFKPFPPREEGNETYSSPPAGASLLGRTQSLCRGLEKNTRRSRGGTLLCVVFDSSRTVMRVGF